MLGINLDYAKGELSLEETLDRMVKHGYVSVLIESWGEYWSKQKDTLIQMLQDRNIVIDSLKIPYTRINNLWSSDVETRNDIIKSYMEYIDEASEYNIPVLWIQLTYKDYVKEPNAYGIDSIMKIAKYAEEKGVKLGLENTRNPKFVEYVLDNILSESLGLCFDTAHSKMYDNYTTRLLEKYIDRLVVLRLTDTDGKRDARLMPGKGIINFKEIFDIINRRFNGNLIIEAYPNGMFLDIDSFLQAGVTITSIF